MSASLLTGGPPPTAYQYPIRVYPGRAMYAGPFPSWLLSAIDRMERRMALGEMLRRARPRHRWRAIRRAQGWLPSEVRSMARGRRLVRRLQGRAS